MLPHDTEHEPGADQGKEGPEDLSEEPEGRGTYSDCGAEGCEEVPEDYQADAGRDSKYHRNVATVPCVSVGRAAGPNC